MQFYKTVDGKKKKAPLLVKIDGKLQIPTLEWYKANGYVEDNEENLVKRIFSSSDQPIIVDDAESTIMKNIYNYDNSIVIQQTSEYFNNDISLIQCFWGEDKYHENAVKDALNINNKFTHPKEWIFVEAQKNASLAKFKELCIKLGIKYKFIKI